MIQAMTLDVTYSLEFSVCQLKEEAAVIPHSEQATLVPGRNGDTASTRNRHLELYLFLGDRGRAYRKIRRLKLP